MSRPVRCFLSFLLVLQLIIPYSTFAAAVGEFSSVVGGVTQTRAREVITPTVKSPVEMKDLIVTARSASATMVFSDDSKITLSENTKLEIKEFLLKEKSRTGIFSLAIGKVTADVKKYIGGDNVFQVHSPTAVVGIRGTGFEYVEAVNAENQGVATISCTEGSLDLSALAPTGEVVSKAVLEAGQVAVIIGGVITISAIGTAAAAALAAKTTETGATGTVGASGTGTGGTAAAGGGATTATAVGSGTTVAAGTAAAATGMSTAAIAGIAIGSAAVVGGTAAAIGGSGGSGSSSGGNISDCSVAIGNWAGTMTGHDECGSPHSGNWTLTINASCTGTMTFYWSNGHTNTDTDTFRNSDTSSGPCKTCDGKSGTGTYSYSFSGNIFNGTWSGCGGVTYYSGSRQ